MCGEGTGTLELRDPADNQVLNTYVLGHSAPTLPVPSVPTRLTTRGSFNTRDAFVTLTWRRAADATSYQVQEWDPATQAWAILPTDDHTIIVSGTSATVLALPMVLPTTTESGARTRTTHLIGLRGGQHIRPSTIGTWANQPESVLRVTVMEPSGLRGAVITSPRNTRSTSGMEGMCDGGRFRSRRPRRDSRSRTPSPSTAPVRW